MFILPPSETYQTLKIPFAGNFPTDMFPATMKNVILGSVEHILCNTETPVKYNASKQWC